MKWLLLEPTGVIARSTSGSADLRHFPPAFVVAVFAVRRDAAPGSTQVVGILHTRETITPNLQHFLAVSLAALRRVSYYVICSRRPAAPSCMEATGHSVWTNLATSEHLRRRAIGPTGMSGGSEFGREAGGRGRTAHMTPPACSSSRRR